MRSTRSSYISFRCRKIISRRITRARCAEYRDSVCNIQTVLRTPRISNAPTADAANGVHASQMTTSISSTAEKTANAVTFLGVAREKASHTSMAAVDTVAKSSPFERQIRSVS